MAYCYNPEGLWTAQHQMSMNGRRDGFGLGDFRECGRTVSLKRGRAEEIVGEVGEGVRRWPEYTGAAGVGPETAGRIGQTHHRLFGG